MKFIIMSIFFFVTLPILWPIYFLILAIHLVKKGLGIFSIEIKNYGSKHFNQKTNVDSKNESWNKNYPDPRTKKPAQQITRRKRSAQMDKDKYIKFLRLALKKHKVALHKLRVNNK